MAKKSNPSPDVAARIRAPKAGETGKIAGHRRAQAPEPEVPRLAITRDDIATLAFSYWERRGYQGGSQEEDWRRAERELRSLLG